MKKRIALIVMLISISSCKIAFAAETGVVTGSSLRVREKSSLSSSISGHLSKATKVEILGKEGEFYKIAYKGKVGYVHSSYINIQKNTTPSRGEDTAQAPATEKSGEITADYLNVRSGAGVSYAVNGVIKRGSKVTLYEKVNGFYKINYGGKISYVSADYVKIIDEKNDSPSSPSSPTSPSPVVTPEVGTTGIGTVKVSDFLSVRSTASISNNIMGRVYPNNKVNIYGSEGQFYKIKFDNKWGYIYKSYVSVVNNPDAKDEKVKADEVVAFASKFMGTPYLWGGATPALFDDAGKYLSGGFDCSGLVQYAYKNFSINLPRTTMDQVNVGESVNIDSLQIGDLIYFRTNLSQPSQVSHVGIYTGNNNFLHAPKTGDVIKISQLTGYYKNNFVIGRRMIK